MKITDLTPQKTDITINYEGKELIFTLRPVTLRDEEWIARHYNQEELQEAFQDIKKLTKIIYQLMTNESKKTLMEIPVVEIDEEGNEKEVKLTGPEKLKALISSLEDQINLIKGVMAARGLSMPIIEEIARAEAEEELKKKQGLKTEQIGQQFTT